MGLAYDQPIEQQLATIMKGIVKSTTDSLQKHQSKEVDPNLIVNTLAKHQRVFQGLLEYLIVTPHHRDAESEDHTTLFQQLGSQFPQREWQRELEPAGEPVISFVSSTNQSPRTNRVNNTPPTRSNNRSLNLSNYHAASMAHANYLSQRRNAIALNSADLQLFHQRLDMGSLDFQALGVSSRSPTPPRLPARAPLQTSQTSVVYTDQDTVDAVPHVNTMFGR
ncbi:hypothetical protein BC833DRAFT_581773 [Globomyces pollinis-pini]|nr:hypothetical protein BC833DRAFT_581773 [Globomyces pollinis-pini]